ncbi:hypothetical protein K796_12553, partial [Salmonella enterica subsp. enterica serovar Newport str. SHSN006]
MTTNYIFVTGGVVSSLGKKKKKKN